MLRKVFLVELKNKHMFFSRTVTKFETFKLSFRLRNLNKLSQKIVELHEQFLCSLC